jgi:hypothetical protein
MRAPRVRLGVILVAILAVAWPALESRLAAQQGRQRAFYVGVVNDAGVPVSDLGIKDFVVKEDNVAREILKVEPAVDPMQIAVLVDTGQHARDVIAHMRSGLPPFFAALTSGAPGTKNEVALVGFGERPTIFTDYTVSPAALEKGMSRVWAQQGSGPYLLDAIVEVSKALKKREAPRPVIVAIAVEGGELSYRHDQETLEALRDSGAAFHTLMIGTPSASMTDEARSRNIVLDRGTVETGGFRDQLLASNALPERLKKLADQLTHQYKVTYARPERLIPPEKVTIAAANPALTAHGVLIKEPKAQGRP